MDNQLRSLQIERFRLLTVLSRKFILLGALYLFSFSVPLLIDINFDNPLFLLLNAFFIYICLCGFKRFNVYLFRHLRSVRRARRDIIIFGSHEYESVIRLLDRFETRNFFALTTRNV